MYRRIFDRHAGDLCDFLSRPLCSGQTFFDPSDRRPITGPPRLEYLEGSLETGEIRFRRGTVSRVEALKLDADPGVLLMTRPPRALNEPCVERFVACV
jgi:hypothetical protein